MIGCSGVVVGGAGLIGLLVLGHLPACCGWPMLRRSRYDVPQSVTSLTA
eukprot:SAG31_NODE_29295_length_397_cov_1.322148_1_plen_48_part_10